MLVVGLLATIATGVAFLALRDQPGARALRAADQLIAAHEEPEKARRVAASTDVNSLWIALMLYKLDNNRYPTESEGLAALTVTPKRLVEKLPTDPWGRPYQYSNPGKRGVVEVFSSGVDGVNGTKDDIGSWQR